MGPFLYALMGTTPQVNLGPSALISLLTFTYTNGTNPDFAILLGFISGVVQLVAGIAQLGKSSCVVYFFVTLSFAEMYTYYV